MRNLKKFVAVIVAIALMASLMVPAFAAEGTLSADAQACKVLGMLEGGNDGLSDAYMASEMDRVQGALLFLRLQGVGKTAEAYEGTTNFADAKDYAPWGQKVMAYLKDNAKYGFVGDTATGNFLPKTKLTAQMYTKILLTAMGYVEGTDFQYATVITEAKALGLSKIADKNVLTPNDVAAATVEALKAKVKGGAKTLAASLVDAKVFTLAQAQEAGVIANLGFTAAPATTKTIKVTFNQAVDTTKAAFAVKNGNVVVAVAATWNADKTEATLASSIALAAGNYTVTVGGLGIEAGKDVANVVIAPERIETINVDSSAYRTAAGGTTVTVAYTVLNQYGEDITANVAVGNLVATASKGAIAGSQPSAAGTITITGVATTETSVDVTVVDKVYAKTGRATASVKEMKGVAQITLSAPQIPTGKTRLEASMTDIVVPYTAVDQYGNAVTFGATGELSALTFVSSDATVVDPASAAITTVGTTKYLTIDTKAFTGLKTVTLTAIVNATGKPAQITFDVYGSATADAPALVAPATRFGASDTAYQVQITVKDQFGGDVAASTVVSDINGGSSPYTITAGNASVFVLNATKAALVDDKAYIQLDAVGNGTANLTVTVNATGKSVTLPLTVVDAKYPASMTLVPDFTYAVKGGAVVLKATFVDQYGDAISTNGNAVKFTVDATNFAAAPANSTVTAMAATGVTLTASDWDKTSTYTAKLYAADGTTVLDTKTITLTSVKSDAALTYKITDLGTVAAYSFTDDTNYAKTVTLYAVDASGNKVALKGDELQQVVSSDVKLDPTALASDIIKAAAVDTDGEATFTAIVNTNTGVVNLPGKVTFSKVAPAAAKIEALAGTTVITKATMTHATAGVDLTANGTLKFLATDQYGQTAACTTNGYVSIFVRNTTTGATTKITDITSWTVPAAGTYKVTAITANGLSVAIDLTSN